MLKYDAFILIFDILIAIDISYPLFHAILILKKLNIKGYLKDFFLNSK